VARVVSLPQPQQGLVRQRGAADRDRRPSTATAKPGPSGDCGIGIGQNCVPSAENAVLMYSRTDRALCRQWSSRCFGRCGSGHHHGGLGGDYYRFCGSPKIIGGPGAAMAQSTYSGPPRPLPSRAKKRPPCSRPVSGAAAGSVPFFVPLRPAAVRLRFL
jgi:hypothetical protein